jgi:hypothetical protein
MAFLLPVQSNAPWTKAADDFVRAIGGTVGSYDDLEL